MATKIKYQCSDPETREKRARSIQKKKNPLAREVLDRKGPFGIRVIDPRKGEYKRVKLNPKNYEDFENEDN